MGRFAFSHLASGTVPYVYSHWVPPQSTGDIVYRDGDQVILINPQDLSVYLSGATKQVSVGTSVIRLDSGITGRRSMAVANLSSTVTLFIGFSSSVTTSTGFPVFPQSSIAVDCTNIYNVYGIAASTITAAVMEVS